MSNRFIEDLKVISGFPRKFEATKQAITRYLNNYEPTKKENQ
jgi:hypothetical protein